MTGHHSIEFEESSGNVFADIGFDEETSSRLAHKADPVGVLHRFQQERGLSQTASGRLVGIPSPACPSSTTARSPACPSTSCSARSRNRAAT